jgi:hypothetical protein
LNHGRADLGSRDARKEDYISNRYDREHDRCTCKKQNSLPEDFRRYNFPNPRLLRLFGEIGKKERYTIVRREVILHHRLIPPATPESVVRGEEPLKPGSSRPRVDN